MKEFSIPGQLLASLKLLPGFSEEEFISAHQSGNLLTSVRLNPFKKSTVFSDQEKVSWCENAFYLAERPSFISDPLFHAGCYYVQEASSMFLDHVLRSCAALNEPLKVLDLCAAPGGKSTLINSCLNAGSLLVSNEVIRTRVPVLAENLSKWGTCNTVVTNNDPRDFSRLPAFFDVMVVDAPCSGSGLFRKQPEAVNEWVESNVNTCSARQQRILADAFPTLKENGLLIYSTCSYSKEENEEIAEWLCDNFELESLRLEVPEKWGIQEVCTDKHKAFGYRFYPHRVKGEGFFIACFRKKRSEEPAHTKKGQLTKPSKAEAAVLDGWVDNYDDHLIFKNGEQYYLAEKAHEADLLQLSSCLYLKKSGVSLGMFKGKDFIPDHQLALSIVLSPKIQSVEVSYQQAIAFLKKEQVNINDAEEGFALLKYKDFSLGWVKILRNRTNNYLPKEWRILKNLED